MADRIDELVEREGIVRVDFGDILKISLDREVGLRGYEEVSARKVSGESFETSYFGPLDLAKDTFLIYPEISSNSLDAARKRIFELSCEGSGNDFIYVKSREDLKGMIIYLGFTLDSFLRRGHAACINDEASTYPLSS